MAELEKKFLTKNTKAKKVNVALEVKEVQDDASSVEPVEVQDETTAEAVATSTEAVATSTEAVATSTEAVATSPEVVATSPEVVATSPEAVATSPEAVATFPEAVAASPEAVAASPEPAEVEAISAEPKTAAEVEGTTAEGEEEIAIVEDLDDPMMTEESEAQVSHEMSTGEVDDEPVLSGLPGNVTAVRKTSNQSLDIYFQKKEEPKKIDLEYISNQLEAISQTLRLNAIAPTPAKSSSITNPVSSPELEALSKATNIEDIASCEAIPICISDEETSKPIIFCTTCRNYLKEGKTSLNAKKTFLSGSFASGLPITREKLTAYQNGNQCIKTRSIWYNFKHNLQDHFKTLLHQEASNFETTLDASRKRSLKVTSNIVAIALQCIKAKTADLHFSTWLSTLEMAGGDIGNIGHSRLVHFCFRICN